jgi:hypothetical protein
VTGYSYVGTTAGGTLTIEAGGTAYTLKFAGDFATSSFSLSAGPPGLFTSSPRPLLITSGGPRTLSGIRGVQSTTDQYSFTPFFHVVGTGDFFDDGNSEILMQNVDGQIAV